MRHQHSFVLGTLLVGLVTACSLAACGSDSKGGGGSPDASADSSGGGLDGGGSADGSGGNTDSGAGSDSGANGNDAGGSDAGLTAPTQLVGGLSHMCALWADGVVKCWGGNGSGQLGLGDTMNRGTAAGQMGSALPAVDLGPGRTAKQIVAAGDHTCARLDNGTVKCWGSNGGELGLGDTMSRGAAANQMGANLPAVDLGAGRTAVDIAAGSADTCALLDNGTVKCWGSNGSGELGQGDMSARGGAANQMGDNLLPVSLGAGLVVSKVLAGRSRASAIFSNGTMKNWGSNIGGSLGIGDALDRGSAANQMGDNLLVTDLGTGRTVTHASLGGAGAGMCAILDNASLKCWGAGGSGQLGQGDTQNRGDMAGQMGDNLPAINLGTGRTVTAIAVGGQHNCALLDDGTVKCWGQNGSGQLGVGDTTTRGDMAGQMGDNLPAVSLGAGRKAVAIGTGHNHTCVILDDHHTKCWGANTSGQLGLGDTNDRGKAAGQLGAALPNVDLGR